MAGAAEMVTGSGAKKQARLAEQAQARQAAEIAAEKARLKAVEDGQLANMQTGGIGGLLAYIDKAGKTGTAVNPNGGLFRHLGGSA